MKKRVLALALALLLCVGLAGTAIASDSEDFVIENGELIEYKGPGGAVTIPNSVTEIGPWAFKGCTNLTSVTIPASVTSIWGWTFKECTSLTDVYYSGSEEQWNAIDNDDYVLRHATIHYNGEMASGSEDFKIKDGVLTRYRGSGSTVTIPDSVTTIGEEAFANCTSLTSVLIPSSVTAIGDCAFRNCTSLTSVSIPNSVTEIGATAFANCTSLTNVTIPKGCEVGKDAFWDTPYQTGKKSLFSPLWPFSQQLFWWYCLF